MKNMYIEGPGKVFFGRHLEWNERIWLTKPSYDCGWYWSFGYLGNKNSHYHLDGYQSKDEHFKLDDGTYKFVTNQRNMNMYDALKADYELSPHIGDRLWQFCEQAQTIYTLKEAAEVLYRGGSHYTHNPMMEVIKKNSFDDNLNQVLLPKLLQKFWDDFGTID